jgi:hypothetical protein
MQSHRPALLNRLEFILYANKLNFAVTNLKYTGGRQDSRNLTGSSPVATVFKAVCPPRTLPSNHFKGYLLIA